MTLAEAIGRVTAMYRHLEEVALRSGGKSQDAEALRRLVGEHAAGQWRMLAMCQTPDPECLCRGCRVAHDRRIGDF